jgi:AcrR family transcriptional regulator
MPKAFSEREKELITARLLEEGHKLFATYGLKKTNVEEIAAAAGVSKGAFYLFYDSKEAFFMDVVEQVERRYRQEILAEIARRPVAARAAVAALKQP